MDAAELYGIVKDVPKEAWPPHLHYGNTGHNCYHIGKQAWMDTIPETGGSRILIDAHATLMFEASMARWLDDRGQEWSCSKDDDGYRVYIGASSIRYYGTTKVASLASACKALAPTPEQRS